MCVLNIVMRMRLCYGLYRDGQPLLEIFSAIPAEIPLVPRIDRSWLRRHVVSALHRPFQSPAVVKSETDERAHYSAAV